MRITITVNDELLLKAIEYAGGLSRSATVQEALRALVARESSLRLARLGGTEPGMKLPRRRRPA